MKLRRKTGQKGFSMIELIIVVAIIAILAVVGIQAFGNIQDRARQNVANSNAALLVGALNTWNAMATATIDQAAVTGVVTAGTNNALVALFPQADPAFAAGIQGVSFSSDTAAVAAARSVHYVGTFPDGTFMVGDGAATNSVWADATNSYAVT